MIIPKDFRQNLANSTLDDSAKEAILKILSTLSQDQVDEIALILRKDIQAQKTLIKVANQKSDMIRSNFKHNLKDEVKKVKINILKKKVNKAG